MYNTGNEIYHYGVLGMKWGVRKAARKDATVQSARKKAKAANKEYHRAMDKYVGTYIGKNRRITAKNNAIDKMAKSIDADKTYKSAYNKAKSKATTQMYKTEGYDKQAVKRIQSMSTGKALAQTFLMGSYGAMKYNEARARGASRGKAATKAVLKNWGNNLSFGAMASREKLNRSVDQIVR